MNIKDKICFFKTTENENELIKKIIDPKFYEFYCEDEMDSILNKNELYNIIIVGKGLEKKELNKLLKFSKKTFTSVLVISDEKKDYYYSSLDNEEFVKYLIKSLCRVSWVYRIGRKYKTDRHERTLELIGNLDNHTKEHSNKVTEYATMMGLELKLDPKEMFLLTSAALLHDIGKTIVPKEILTSPNRLSKEEFEIIKLHTVILDNIIENRLSDVKHIIRHHHEKFDGTGYPDGLKGEEIPLLSRVITVADSFDAMTSQRVYNNPITFEKGKEILVKDSDTHFDRKIAEMFIKLLNEKNL
jgi:HD-GYP domain